MWNIFNKLFRKPEQSGSTTTSAIGSGKILSAKVIKVEKHPNADRLRVISLDIGNGQIIEPVVCGAFNFDVGAIVALALPGAKIAHNIHSDTHEPFTLDKATIRGVESQGMICAAFELGATTVLDDKPEIMVLPESTTIGTILPY